jgi:putative acetyltransferase
MPGIPDTATKYVIVITLRRTDSSDMDFRMLVSMLDEELSQRDGDEYPFYAQFNKLDTIRHVLVAYVDQYPVGCGAFRTYQNTLAEIKRMYVRTSHRGQGIASLLLAGLEQWALESNFRSTILETGYNQPEAIALYRKSGYIQCPNYGPYAGVSNSICFSKDLPGAELLPDLNKT